MEPAEPLFVTVTYTRGKDKGVQLHLPVHPAPEDAWRKGVRP